MNSVAEIHHAVLNLLNRYAEAVDDGDFAVLRELFRHAELYTGDESTPSYSGADGVEQMFRSFPIYYDESEQPVDAPRVPGTPRTTHLISNAVVEVAPDLQSAAARSRYTVFQCLSDFPLQPIIQGRYDDRFDCSGSECHFVSRRYRMDFAGDLSRHLQRMPD